MSEYDKPIRDLSPIEYLRDFINTQLVLTFQEEKNLEYLYDLQRRLPVKAPQKGKSERTKLATQGVKKCKVCEQVLNINEFYNGFGICKHCYSERRKQKRLER